MTTVFFTIAGATLLRAQQLPEAGLVNREYQIKAAYLYNFARYIQWPEDTFQHEKEPFRIGIVGTDPIKQDLELLAKTKTIDKRPIQIRYFAKPLDVKPCQILFLSPSLEPEVQQKVLQKMAGKNVLFVGQTSGFLNMGGVIGFVVNENRVRLVVDLDAAQREKLKFSAKLLRVAKVIR